MNLARPEQLLHDRAALALLVALARAGGHAAVGDLPGGDGAALVSRIETSGLVAIRGERLMLNREHVLAMAVEQLAGARARLLERLRFHLTTWDPAPQWAAVAGSLARGEGDDHADIDLLLVAPAAATADRRWANQLAALATDVEAWSGNRLHPILLAAAPSERDGLIPLLGAA